MINYSDCFLAKLFSALTADARSARSHNHYHSHHRDLAVDHSIGRFERRAGLASCRKLLIRWASVNFRCFGNDSVLSFLVFPHLKLHHAGSQSAALGSPTGSPARPAHGTTPQRNGDCVECHRSARGTFLGSYELIHFPCRNQLHELSGQSVGLSRRYCGNPSDGLL